MSSKLHNVKSDIRGALSQDTLAVEVATALDGLFVITSYKRFRAFNANYIGLYAEPTKTIRNALSIEREVFVLIAPYSNLHARTIKVIQEQVAAEQPRLQPDVAVVMHQDATADESLRAWGRESGLTVLPIFRPTGGVMPPSALVRQRLSRELFATDSFQITGPVSDDNDFFGRREQALSLLRQLHAGRIEAIFGLRKVGKTSMLNRVIDLANSAGSPRIAMVDCSLKGFNELNAQDALQAIARLARLADRHGYAHISQTLRQGDADVHGTFEGLWSDTSARPLLIVLDEVDYITPQSPTSPHWSTEFSPFWREFRAVVQESKRHNFDLGLLVSGVSSRSFRAAEIEGVENPVLHFVPENYLTPFEPGAAVSMLGALGKRCGVILDNDARAYVASACAYLPYWMRMAGSYIHRHLDLEDRPIEAGIEQVRPLCDEFARGEGAEIARVALQSLQRVDAPMYEKLIECQANSRLPLQDARPLMKYGLVRQRGTNLQIEASIVMEGLGLIAAEQAASSTPVVATFSFDLDESEWAEELASISRRRNILERKAREFVRVVLRMALPPDKLWQDVVRAALAPRRREECLGLTPDSLMGKLYWLELGNIIGREWTSFERFFDDKKRMQSAFALLNERPDAHAKDVDLADIALQRRELTWLEERIAQ